MLQEVWSGTATGSTGHQRPGSADLAGAQAVRLVLSDLRMADGDGVELYQAIAARHPQLAGRFIAMTGDTLGSTRDRLPPEVRRRLVEKPIDLVALRRVLAERLAGLRQATRSQRMKALAVRSLLPTDASCIPRRCSRRRTVKRSPFAERRLPPAPPDLVTIVLSSVP